MMIKCELEFISDMIKIKAMINKNKGRSDFLHCSESGYIT